MRLLVVEDDAKTASFVVKGLSREGFAVDRAADGETGLKLMTSEEYAVAVVDIMLPGMDGLSLISVLRRRRIATPVLILSAKRAVDDRVRGLAAGGDDYLPKPFSFAELLARTHALLRRSGQVRRPERLEVGDLSMDLNSRRVTRGEREIELRPHEYALLELLMTNAGRPVSKAMILDNVWNYDFDPQTNVVDVLACRLREKIGAAGDPSLIHTLRGIGYVLRAS